VRSAPNGAIRCGGLVTYIYYIENIHLPQMTAVAGATIMDEPYMTSCRFWGFISSTVIFIFNSIYEPIQLPQEKEVLPFSQVFCAAGRITWVLTP
jgi:hypothetical protein